MIKLSDKQIIDDIYQFTGLVISNKSVKEFKNLIEHYIEEYKVTYFCECDKN